MLWYLDYIVQSQENLIKKINLCFLTPGHTKVGPNQLFGLANVSYNKHYVISVHQAIDVIHNSMNEDSEGK